MARCLARPLFASELIGAAALVLIGSPAVILMFGIGRIVLGGLWPETGGRDVFGARPGTTPD